MIASGLILAVSPMFSAIGSRLAGSRVDTQRPRSLVEARPGLPDQVDVASTRALRQHTTEPAFLTDWDHVAFRSRPSLAGAMRPQPGP